MRFWTTAVFAFGVLLALGWPWLVGPQPQREAPRRERARYAARFATYVSALIAVFGTSGILAILTVRQERARYRREARENLREFLEGTLRDHARGSGKSDDRS
ncbi:MAG: hypothetical protein N2109_08545 [Fimbriimonadales bacterium]|nr:hypothetical protein [Fimbriimonadales bacterium]